MVGGGRRTRGALEQRPRRETNNGGAALLAGAKAVARARRRGMENQALLWYRILSTGALMAPRGWLAGQDDQRGTNPNRTATGLARGLLGVRPQKVILGPLVGAAVARGWQHADAGMRRPRWRRSQDVVGPGFADGRPDHRHGVQHADNEVARPAERRRCY